MPPSEILPNTNNAQSKDKISISDCSDDIEIEAILPKEEKYPDIVKEMRAIFDIKKENNAKRKRFKEKIDFLKKQFQMHFLEYKIRQSESKGIKNDDENQKVLLQRIKKYKIYLDMAEKWSRKLVNPQDIYQYKKEYDSLQTKYKQIHERYSKIMNQEQKQILKNIQEKTNNSKADFERKYKEFCDINKNKLRKSQFSNSTIQKAVKKIQKDHNIEPGEMIKYFNQGKIKENLLIVLMDTGAISYCDKRINKELLGNEYIKYIRCRFNIHKNAMQMTKSKAWEFLTQVPAFGRAEILYILNKQIPITKYTQRNYASAVKSKYIIKGYIQKTIMNITGVDIENNTINSHDTETNPIQKKIDLTKFLTNLIMHNTIDLQENHWHKYIETVISHKIVDDTNFIDFVNKKRQLRKGNSS